MSNPNAIKIAQLEREQSELRDEIAIVALQSLLTVPHYRNIKRAAAEEAYRIANEMLEARNKG